MICPPPPGTIVGRWDDAIAAYQTVLQLSPGFIGTHYYIGEALLLKGNIEAALAEFEQEEDEEFRTKGQAVALYALGRQDVSKAKLQELIDSLRDDPRWLPLLEQMGKSPTQLDAIEFNVTLPK